MIKVGISESSCDPGSQNIPGVGSEKQNVSSVNVFEEMLLRDAYEVVEADLVGELVAVGLQVHLEEEVLVYLSQLVLFGIEHILLFLNKSVQLQHLGIGLKFKRELENHVQILVVSILSEVHRGVAKRHSLPFRLNLEH